MADERVCQHEPGYTDDLLVIGSTPVEYAKSRPDRHTLRIGRGRRLRLVRLAFPVLLGIQVQTFALRRHPPGA